MTTAIDASIKLETAMSIAWILGRTKIKQVLEGQMNPIIYKTQAVQEHTQRINRAN